MVNIVPLQTTRGGGMLENQITIQKEIEDMGCMADVFTKSGVFPDVKSQAQGIVKIMAGKELGLTPFQSLAGLYFVNGKIGIQANIVSGLIRKSKKYDYSIIKATDEFCEIDFFDISDKETPKKLGTSSFGKVDAAKSGLINKDNYKNYPSDMYFARAISRGAKRYAPDALMGYSTIEELQDVETEIIPAKTMVAIDVNAEVDNGKKT